MLLSRETDRALERAFTPYPVIRAGMGYALELLAADVAGVLRRCDYAPRILDWCAGAGPWATVAREWWPRATITTVELVPSERRYLERVADRVLIGDWRLALDHGPYDLVVGNPAFSQLVAAPGRHPKSSGVLQLLRHAPIVIVLHTIEVLQRSANGRWVARRRPPAVQVDLPGGIEFWGPDEPGQDLRSYAVYGWTRHHRGPGWRRVPLPHELSPDERRFAVRPGTEAR